MKLYTFYKIEDKVVYGAAVNGRSVFFFSGFESTEEAKSETKRTHLEYKKQKWPKVPVCVLEAEIDMVLAGEWSRIE